MTWHLHGTILTAQGTAGNNRGDSEGVKSTLQKIYRDGEPYTTVSSEAIRYALREYLQNHDDRDPAGERLSQLQVELERVNAQLAETESGSPKKKTAKKKAAKKKKASNGEDQPDPKKLERLSREKAKLETEIANLGEKVKNGAFRLNRWMPDHRSNEWHDDRFARWEDFLDDDVLGFMHATANRSHRGLLEITRAISTTPWRGEVVVNYATPNSNPGIGGTGPNPYAAEVHHTRYQYTFSMTPEHLSRDAYNRTKWVLEGLLNIRRVGGNHAHFLFDFAPEAIVLRWTHDPAPRIVYCFDEDEYGALSLRRLKTRIDKGDICIRKRVNGNSATDALAEDSPSSRTQIDEKVKDDDSDQMLWIGSVCDIADCPELTKECGPDVLGPAKAIEKVLERIEATLKND